MTIQTKTTDRKALAKAIAEELRTECRYMGMPSCGYQIGEYTVDRDGNIIGENFDPLHGFLVRNGYIQEPGQGEPEHDAPATLPEAEPITSMEVSIPAQDATPVQLKNLAFMLYSRQDIINRMAQSDCLHVPDSLIDRLKEYTPDTRVDFTSLLDDCRTIAGLEGFDFRDGKVTMTFPFDEAHPERWTAYANLLNRIFVAAVKATRVSPERIVPDEQNEKYLAHVWLQRLGYGGADSKAERKILLGHLKGYCAFSNGTKMQAHKEKYTAIRRKRRQAAQAAVETEVQGND